MASISNEQPMQAFRNPSTDEVVNIPTHKDPDTSNLVVLWQDIQDMFDNIEYIKDGKSLVSFLTDDNLVQITPLRIAYYPGAVLELVVGSNSRAADGGAMAPTKAISQDHNNRSVVVHSGKISDDTSVIVHNYIQALLLGQQRHAANIKQSIDERFDQLLAVMDKDRERQELLIWMQQQTGDKQLQIQNLQQQTKEELLEKLVQLYQLHQQAEARLLQSQQEIMDIQHQSREEILKKNDEIVQLQVQALDRMVAMYNRIQAIVTQTSELHEHPIPRLFIILPKFKLPEIKTTHSHPGGFRLYFLCECGIHTTSEDKMSAPVIHMAKHGGYDLENPEEFFEKYGSYSLTLMQMIKYGPVVSNLAVPSLTQLLDGLEASQENLEYIKNNIPALVDDSINFLQGFKVNSESEVATIHEELDMSEAFSKADLRQLESYLKIEDRGDVLGRLSRIVTPEGHIKWVCLDHRHSNYQEANIQRLKEVVDNSQGTFLEQEGKVTIAVMSSVMAKEFNDAVIRAHRVQELDISLGWDATREDLRAFANAVTKTKVVSLTIHGSHFKRGPRLDDLNPGERFDSLQQLAFNGHIQSLQLRGFEDFFSRVSDLGVISSPTLRQFSLEWHPPYKEKSKKAFRNFLQSCPNLTTVTVNQRQFPIEDTMDDNFGSRLLEFRATDCDSTDDAQNFQSFKTKLLNFRNNKLKTGDNSSNVSSVSNTDSLNDINKSVRNTLKFLNPKSKSPEDRARRKTTKSSSHSDLMSHQRSNSRFADSGFYNSLSSRSQDPFPQGTDSPDNQTQESLMSSSTELGVEHGNTSSSRSSLSIIVAGTPPATPPKARATRRT